MNLAKRMLNRLYRAGFVLRYGELPSSRRDEVPSITQDEVEEIKTFFPMEKFFVFGHARSGTTLLMRLIDLHPEIHCNRQAHFFTRPPFLQSLVSDSDVAEWLSRRSVRWNRGKDLSPVVLRAAADYILERDARFNKAQIVGDKSPNSLVDGEAVRLMHQIYPEGRLIYIVRDGRDVAVSHRFQAFIEGYALSNESKRIRDMFQKNPEHFYKPEISLFTEQDIRQSAIGWVKNVTETFTEGKRLYGDRFLIVYYEQLLSDPIVNTKIVWEFLGGKLKSLDLDEQISNIAGFNRDARWQQEKAGDIAKEIPKGKSGSWQQLFNSRDIEIFKEIAGEALIMLGYEQDLSWG